MGPLTTARRDHKAALLSDGSVLVVGGGGSSGQLASAEVFNPVTLRWSSGGSMAAARSTGHTATLLPDGRVLVAGGGGASGPLATSEIYDPTRTPASARWAVGPGLGFARREHTATLLTTGAVLIAGGFDFGDIANCRLYRTSFPRVPPTLASATDPVMDGRVDLTGSGFTSRSQRIDGYGGGRLSLELPGRAAAAHRQRQHPLAGERSIRALDGHDLQFASHAGPAERPHAGHGVRERPADPSRAW